MRVSPTSKEVWKLRSWFQRNKIDCKEIPDAHGAGDEEIAGSRKIVPEENNDKTKKEKK